MAKGNRGGRRQTAQTIVNANQGVATPQANPNVNTNQVMQDILNGDTIEYEDYLALSDDEKADAIMQMVKQPVPQFLANNELQRFIYYAGVEGKPTLVSDSALDSINGKDLYRTINDVYDKSSDVNYTSKQIANQIMKGDVTRVSDTGGSAYGRGIYFADDYNDSKWYGTSGKSSMVRAKVTGKIGTYSNLYNKMKAEINSGSKIGKVYSKLNNTDALSIWCLNNGYCGYDAGGYYVISNRSGLTMSTKIKANPINSTKW